MSVISSYAAAGSMVDTDVVIGNSGATTKKFTGLVIKTYVLAGGTAMTLNTQVASYTAVLADADNVKIVAMNVGSANNFTIPPNSSVAYPTGSQIEVLQLGAGQTTIVAGAGVTLNKAAPTLKLSAQYARAVLLKTATDTWIVSGDLALS